jgi:Flp pilus assembly protein TadB
MATDRRGSGQQANNYPLLWIVLAVLSTNVSVPAIRRIVQHAGIAGSRIALAIAIVLGLLIGLAIAVVNRIEKRSYQYALVAVFGAFLFLLWYWSH